MLGYGDSQSSLLILSWSWRQQTLYVQVTVRDGCASLLFYMAFILSFCPVDAWINSACQRANQLQGGASFTLSPSRRSSYYISLCNLCRSCGAFCHMYVNRMKVAKLYLKKKTTFSCFPPKVCLSKSAEQLGSVQVFRCFFENLKVKCLPFLI